MSGASRIHRVGWATACALAVLVALPGPASAAAAKPTITVAPQTVTPYHSGGCWNPSYPCYRVSGVADPGVKVIVTVTDESSSGFAVRVSTFAADFTDPWCPAPPDACSGFRAGDWAVAPNVTDLGSHDETSSNLVFTAVALDSAGNQSDPATITVTKTAATPRDTTPPKIERSLRKPFTDQWCRTCPLTQSNQIGYGGNREISGSVSDDVPEAYGIESEIRDVTIRVVDGRTGDTVIERHEFTRRGTRAYWGTTLNGFDFEPLVTYTVFIEAVDAVGNEAQPVVFGFTMLI